MTDQAIAAPRRTSAVERYLDAETRLWQHYGLAAAGAVRRDRPAASEASRAGGRIGSAGAVRPRHRRSGIVAVAGRRHAGLPVSRPRSARMGSQHAGRLPPGGVPPVRRRPAAPHCSIRSTSTGSTWSAGRSATCGRSAWPNTIRTRVGRVVLLGGGPIVADVRVPGFIRALASPIGAVIVRLPTRSGSVAVRSFASNGHAASLEDGRVPTSSSLAARAGQRHSGDAHERDMVRGIVRRVGLAAGLHVRRGPARPASRSRRCSSTGQPTRPAASRSGGVSRTPCPMASCRSWRGPVTIRGSRTCRASPSGCRASWRDRRAIRRRSRRPMPGGRAPRGRCS